MPLKDNNVILIKSKAFACRIVNLHQYLTDDHNPKRERTLSTQILRSGTSIGANVRESRRAQSSKDFIAKLYIALKEADETQYWLELLEHGKYINKAMFDSMNNDCEELLKLLTSIIKSAQDNLNNSDNS